jgi:hypothetical protein
MPVPNTMTMVYARNKVLGNSPGLSRMLPIPIGDARADGSGRFQLNAPRTSSSRYDTFGAVAIAPGYGLGWVDLDANADQPAADITLRPEDVIRGRLFDIQGMPAQGVTISVWEIRPLLPKVPALSIGCAEGVGFWWTNDDNFPAWPKPATADADGRFTVRGVGQNMRAFLTARHPRFALQQIDVETDGSSESKPITLALEPAKVITGRVIYADTGKPVPHAQLAVVTRNRHVPDFEADAEGRFRINPPSGDRYVENLVRWLPRRCPRRSFRSAWARARCRGPGPLLGSEAQARRDGRILGQVSDGRTDYSPSESLWFGQGATRESRRQAGRGTSSTPREHQNGRDPRLSRHAGERKGRPPRRR